MLGALSKTPHAVNFAVVRLHEDILSFLHQAVAHLAFQANIGNLSTAVVIGAGAVPIQRVAVRIGVLYAKHDSEVDLVLK